MDKCRQGEESWSKVRYIFRGFKIFENGNSIFKEISVKDKGTLIVKQIFAFNINSVN